MPFVSITRGAAYHIVALQLRNGHVPALDYLEGLPASEKKRIAAVIELVAQDGPPRDGVRSKHVEGEPFWEFRAAAQRVFWCYGPGRRIVLLHGYTKKSARIPRVELSSARERYWMARSELGAE